MPATPEARRKAFAAFVNRALRHAEISKDWSLPRVAKESRVGASTIYRWTKGEWREYPKGELVEQFCDALGIPTAAAFSILWPGASGKPTEAEPIPIDPDLERLARKLRDPNVPDTEKYLIRETVRSLASRPNRPPDMPRSRRTG